jgi:putative PIN family toxin of toxin-antitoxin system
VIRAVLDCNVVLSVALTDGPCAEILARIRAPAGYDLVWSPPIVAECLRVIAYPKFAGRYRIDPRAIIERAAAAAHMVAADLLPAIDVVKADPTDNVYIATALAGGAKWIVTGDKRHLPPHDGYAGLRVVLPAQFLEMLDSVRLKGG